MPEYGYAGNILKVDLSDGEISRLPTAEYADRFLGGRGIAAKLYWDTVPPGAGAFDPDNGLIFATGPVTGFPGFAGYRWQVCGKSPTRRPEVFSYANLGGRWGAALKYAGYDVLSLRGKALNPVYLYIDEEQVEIKDASHLWGKNAFEAVDVLKGELGKDTRVLTIGPAAENRVSFATLLTDDGSSGSAGLGAVLGSKRVKAVAVHGGRKPRAADPERLRDLAQRVKELRDKPFYVDAAWAIPGVTDPYICHGCGIGCARQTYTAENGRRFKYFCQSAYVYAMPVMERYGKWHEVALLANRLCDGLGLDTSVMFTLIGWLSACHRQNLLGEVSTELRMPGIGTAEFIETLTRKIAYREGFGDVLARGTIEAAGSVGKRAEEMLGNFVSTRGSDTKDYDPRLIPVTALLYATEPRRPIQQLHEPSIVLMMWLKWLNGEKDAFFTGEDFQKAAERFWGGSIAADYTTLEGKAMAAKKIQDRTYAKESLILCDFAWPMIWAKHPGGHVGDPTLESRIFSAITGKEMDETELNRIGERIFNLQRAVLIRQGWEGRNDDRLLDYFHREPLKEGEVYFDPDCLVPGRDGEVVSKKGNVLDREGFEKMKDEYYDLRGWDGKSGLPKKGTLKGLGLEDVVGDLAEAGLLK